MSQRVALVTGSTSGIGEAIARRLASDGFHVVVHSGSSVEEGERIAEEVEGSYLQADLSDADAALATVSEALAQLGRLDVLVNNAGVSRRIPHADLEAATPAEWRSVLEVNLISPFALTTAAAPYLRRTHGCVVNVTSHAGVRPKGSSIPYAASKSALNHVTRLLAVALGPEVRVNAVAPGLVDTPLTAGWDEAQDLWRERSPMRRAATPEDVAGLVADLVASAYLTGEVVVLDGGLNLL
ncbi:MAG TPA: SDR family oxidoreductase [Nocardioides sp.]|nr:SDR family oxidoreductase [Nocardioides sp.]